MSEGLFKNLGSINGFFKRQSWLTRPIYYLLDKWVPAESKADLHWDEEADLAILEQTPIRAKKLLYSIPVSF